MKQFFYIFLFSALPLFALATNGEISNDDEYTQVANEIASAISRGDAAAVAKYFDSSVDVTILDQSGTYSKSQAEQMLKSFFGKNKVSDFRIIHNVDSPDGSSSSFIGQLNSSSQEYQMYVLLSESGSSKIIQEIKIYNR